MYLQFEVGDMALLKLCPHGQTSVQRRINQKLAPRFYGPFRIIQKLSAVSYKLELPESAKVHPIFHVSQLRRVKGDHPVITQLPGNMEVEDEGFLPEDILATRRNQFGNEE